MLSKTTALSALFAVVVWQIWSILCFYNSQLLPNLKSNEYDVMHEKGTSFLWCPDGYTLLQDIHITDAEAMPSRIPRIFRQTAPSRCIDTSLFNQTVSKWLNFGWIYEFADDEMMNAYLNDEKWAVNFPQLSLALQCIEHAHKPVSKADLWRYLVLWEFGGIYADLDALPHSLFNASTLGQHDAIFVRCDDSGSSTASQWFFAAAPRHPVMRDALLFAMDNVLKGVKILPIRHTGPGALYTAISVFTGGKDRSLLEDTLYEKEDRSFYVLPKQMARNQAVIERDRSYEKMNITDYNRQPGMWKKMYQGKRCFEFLNGTETHDGFILGGKKYHWYN